MSAPMEEKMSADEIDGSRITLSFAELLAFCQTLPKVELHAHLSGSISENTIQKLLQKRKHCGQECPVDFSIKDGEKRELDDCFALFTTIHQITDNTDAIYMLTKDVIREFAEDGVRYLELRSTPRDVPTTGMNKYTYIESILRAIEDCKKETEDIIVKLILTINRESSVEVANGTVLLADEYSNLSNGVVVGVDLAGNPSVGDLQQFIPVFKNARMKGLKVTMHLAEIENIAECEAVLKEMCPDRIGHGTFLLPDCGGTAELRDIVLAQQIPIEFCLTSNVKAQTVKDYSDHHFQYWYQIGQPCLLCTDDKGSFETSLSQEYAIAAKTFNLTKEQLWQISYDSIDSSFADDDVKKTLKSDWIRIKRSIFPSKLYY